MKRRELSIHHETVTACMFYCPNINETAPSKFKITINTQRQELFCFSVETILSAHALHCDRLRKITLLQYATLS